jgi:hypothetical protein
MTEPDNVLHMHYVGAPERFICFASCVLKDGRVVVHSLICDTNRGPEDFLYEVVERHEAVRTATTMVQDAIDYLQECGDRVGPGGAAQDFLDKLKQELTHGLH